MKAVRVQSYSFFFDILSRAVLIDASIAASSAHPVPLGASDSCESFWHMSDASASTVWLPSDGCVGSTSVGLMASGTGAGPAFGTHPVSTGLLACGTGAGMLAITSVGLMAFWTGAGPVFGTSPVSTSTGLLACDFSVSGQPAGAGMGAITLAFGSGMEHLSAPPRFLGCGMSEDIAAAPEETG